MEKRINKKFENYITDFKQQICIKAKETGISSEELTQFNEFIFEFPRCIIDKDELVKRKRVKNSIPVENRCSAKRSNGEQCTRRKKGDHDFCGTHCKSVPHGLIGVKEQSQKVEIFTQDIKGIIYYIDHFQNVYRMEDVLEGSQDPKIIGKYNKIGDVHNIEQLY